MAEQEACASAVTEALAAAGESTEAAENSDARGESLLLPLLQGLLGGGGERLLAGLGAAGADVVADVRRSLGRLRAALAPPADHPQARALLTLADRLEDALDAADRLDGCKKRPRRRSRAARHTVGVTREELQEARRLVDRDQLVGTERVEPPTPPTPPTPPSTVPSEEPPTPERKQSVDEEVSYHDAIAARPKLPPVAHSASYETAPKVNRDARVVERREPSPRKPEFFRHSIADATPQRQQPPSQPRMDRRPSDTKSSIAAIANKFNAQVEKETMPTRRAPAKQPHLSAPTVQPKQIVREDRNRAPLYMPLPPGYNFAAPPAADDAAKPLNRFNNSKRSRMKRANTIDIGKPLGGYRLDGDTDEESTGSLRGPLVPEFQPQTENDRKFLAFMQKNDENRGTVAANGHANWSNRFGNIKNAFESREREERSRSSSASSAKRFWQAADDPSAPAARPPRRTFGEINPDRERPRAAWTAERRDSLHSQAQPAPLPPAPSLPPVPQSPTKPVVIKPFVAKPIPVNQFSHAPMSAFKPPKKIVSPTSAPPLVWSPPSMSNVVSPTTEYRPGFPPSPQSVPPSPPALGAPWAADGDRPKRVLGLAAAKFENNRFGSRAAPLPAAPPPQSPQRERPYGYNPPTPPAYAPPQSQNYPMNTIPSQNNLAAPELVKNIDRSKSSHEAPETYPKIDAQKLQIEFYEKQIREKNRREPLTNGHGPVPGRKPPAPPAHPPQPTYTVTDYTPVNVVSTFVPLQQTPDIEKARAHKVDYLPDVVMNENSQRRHAASPTARNHVQHPPSPRAKGAYAHHNGDAATEHSSVVTRVMRGPVCGAATITAGVRTRGDEPPRALSGASAAKNLKGVLEKFSLPKREALTQIEKKKRDVTESQVRPTPLVQNGHAPSPASTLSPRPLPVIEYEAPVTPPGRRFGSPRSPATHASRESVASSESALSRDSSPGALGRSESWHRLAEGPPQPRSPRRVVSRAKSMHLLAVPKLFEGGIAREQLTEKKKTVEAYFSGAATTGASKSRARSARSSLASSQPARPFSLGRSRTMPTVSELQFLDESNADDAFEDLVSGLA